MAKKKKGPGRPKGSGTRGPTVAVGFRISKDLHTQLEEIRRRNRDLRTKSATLEKVLRDGLAAQLARSPAAKKAKAS